MMRAAAAVKAELVAPRPQLRHGRLRAAWAAVGAVLLGLLFTGLTVATVALWAIDPAYTHTNPVVDLAFLGLGMMVAVGFASQVRTPSVAGLQQAVLALVALRPIVRFRGSSLSSDTDWRKSPCQPSS
jgi:hypothetical protein